MILASYFLLLAGIMIGQVYRFSPLSGADLSLRLADLTVAVVVLGWLLVVLGRYLRQKTGPIKQLTKADRYLLAFQAILLLTSLLNLHHFDHRSTLIGLSYQVRLQGYLMLYWVGRSWGEANVDATRWQGYFLWATVIVAVIGFVQLATFSDFRFMADFGWDPHVGRLLSTFYDPNFVAVFIGLGFLLAVNHFLFYREERGWYLGLAAILLVALYFTYSRSGIFSTAIAAVILGARRNWRSAVVLLLLFVVMIFLPGRLSGRFTTLFTTTKIKTSATGQAELVSTDDTGNQRVLSWKRALTVIRSAPLIGVGYNNFAPATVGLGIRDEKAITVGAAQSSDASLLNIWATTGLFGLLAFLAFAWQVIRSGWLRGGEFVSDPTQRWKVGFAITAIALAVNSIFINSLLYPQLLIYWTVFAGLLISSSPHQKTALSPNDGQPATD